MIDYKQTVQTIHLAQIKSLYTLDNFKKEVTTKVLERKHRGLYWIWSSETFDNLAKVITAEQTKQVPFERLISQRKGFSHICQPMFKNFRVVYNGKGGYLKNSKGFGLRERILQELNCSDHRTGTMNLENRNIERAKWAISFFDFDSVENQTLISEIKESNFYEKYADALEVGWRLEYGIPILSRY